MEMEISGERKTKGMILPSCLSQISVVGLPITDRCNLKCQHCLREKYLKSGYLNESSDTTPEMIHTFCEHIAGVSALVNISAGYGEPLLNPNCANIIQVLHQYNYKVLMYTNATLLPIMQAFVEDMLPEVLIVSIDSYHLVKLEQLCPTLNHIAELYNKTIEHRIVINYCIDPLSFCESEVRRVIDIANKHKITVELHWTHFYEPISIDLNSYTKMIHVLKLLKKSIESKKNNNLELPRFKFTHEVQCRSIENSVYFSKDGWLRYCCISYKPIINQNIFQTSLKRILESNEYQKMLAKMDEIGLCQMCPIGHGNVFSNMVMKTT